MITLANGYKFEFVVASGAWGFDGDDAGHGFIKLWKKIPRWLGYFDRDLFTVIIKSLTYQKRTGNLTLFRPWRCVRSLGNGSYVNAVGLTNPGYQYWIENYWPRMEKRGYQTIVSMVAEHEPEAITMVNEFNRLKKLKAIELNVSCPNTTDRYDDKLNFICDMYTRLKEVSEHPIILKLGYTDPCYHVARELGSSLDALDLINAVPWQKARDSIYHDSPLAKYNLHGGVSGRRIVLHAREILDGVKKTAPDIPVISGGGITGTPEECLNEMRARYALGADAFSFGTVFLSYPKSPYKAIQMWLCERKETDPIPYQQRHWLK